MKKNIIVDIHFNDWNYARKQKYSQEWMHDRMNITMTYTIPSLKKQTNQDFIAIFRCDGQTMDLIEEELSQYEPIPANIIFMDHKLVQNYIKQQLNQDEEKVYVVRLDSDDTYRKDYIETLYQTKHQPNKQFLICQNGYIYDHN